MINKFFSTGDILDIFRKKIRNFLPIMRYSIRQFFIDDCLYKASALTFTTLLSIVPLMSVSFTVLSAFPQSKIFAAEIQSFIFDSFVAGKGKLVESYLQEFAMHVSELSSIGLLFLISSAVMMLFTIERSMNQIWRVKERRHGVSAFLMYWAILTLVPFLLGVSLAISSYFMSLPFYAGAAKSIGIDSLEYIKWLPTIFSFIIFLVLYIAVPNIKIRIRSGLLGAFFATFLFSVSKWGFSLYLQQYKTYELLYGAFSIIPIFLVWLYIVWIVVLFGAEIAHACSIGRLSPKDELLDPFSQTLIWLKSIWVAQNSGKILTLHDLTDQDSFRYSLTPIEQLNSLIEAKLIRLTAKGGLLLSCDLRTITIGDLLISLPWKIPNSVDLPSHELLNIFRGSLEQVEENTKEPLGKDLYTIFVSV
ncbi:MAG: YihY family inner membrane protein [Legionellales bacterium]|nr:YihY family inner membrane protein [Legionellales bacterium]